MEEEKKDNISQTQKEAGDEGRGYETCLIKKWKDTRKGKPYEEIISGANLYKNAGKMMDKLRIIDKPNDYYLEIVRDPQTGEIIHIDFGRLSEHRGHGSAKKSL